MLQFQKNSLQFANRKRGKEFQCLIEITSERLSHFFYKVEILYICTFEGVEVI